MSPNPHIAFLGGGNMTSAIVSGMIGRGFMASHISVVDHNAHNCERLTAQFGVNAYLDIQKVKQPDAWVLAVKPQNMQAALTELTPLLNPNQLLISIAAGLTIATLSSWTGQHAKIARTMPNTPSLVGQGVTGIFAPSTQLNEYEQRLLDQLFKAVGETVWLNNESEIDAITAITGSGPAYVFYMLEHLAQAAVSLGFDEATAQHLAKQTFAGAVALANVSPDNFTTLREKVTSKGGTTAAAIATFNQRGIGEGIIAGAQAATARAKELAVELAR